jgi:hypothetical protein
MGETIRKRSVKFATWGHRRCFRVHGFCIAVSIDSRRNDQPNSGR